MFGTEGQLVSDIVNKLQYWIFCGHVKLQTVAVKICCNLSLVDSHRSALAETGILDSVFRKSFVFFVIHHYSSIHCMHNPASKAFCDC